VATLQPDHSPLTLRDTDGLAVLDKNWRVREHLAMMKRNIDLEIKLINELLDLSRISSGKVELEIETVAVNEIVRHVCESYRSRESLRDLRRAGRPQGRTQGLRHQQGHDPVFQADKAMPAALVKKLIKTRIAENVGRSNKAW
jgi:signal transduction histidine kinase